MTIGPLELVVVGYEGDRIPRRIGVELGTLEHAGSVRIVDLAVLDAPEGVAAARMAHELTDEELRPLAGALGDVMGSLRPEDLERAAAVLPPGGHAVVALVEHTWQTGLRDAVAGSASTMLLDELLAPEAVERRNAELAELELAAE
jgi:hypothetical protein